MNNSIQSQNSGRSIARSVALPAEKGSWSLVSEPIVLGLLAAPSWAGAALAMGAFFMFLCNRPLKVYLADRRRGRAYERTAVALRFLLGYAAMALVGLAVGFALGGWRPFVPLLAALPLLALFAVYDQRPGRHWQAELTAPVAFAAIVAAMALADGWAWPPALGLWGFMIARAVPAVLFIRARLRLDKGKEAAPGESLVAVFAAHVLAVVAVAGLVWAGWLPWLAVVAAVVLLARAVWGLSAWRRRISVIALGFLETGFGLLAVLLVAIGFWIE
jgi:hypothetical protein